MFTPEQTKLLEAKLSSRHIKTRRQSGRTLSYLEGWVAIDEANRIFGFDGWCRKTVYCREVCRYDYTIGEGGQNPRNGWKVGYEAKVRVTVGEAMREGTGHGNGIAADLYDAIESAAKEAETDAMKRALMTFGNQFGLALYDKDQKNVTREGGGLTGEADKRLGDSIAKSLKPTAKKWTEAAWKKWEDGMVATIEKAQTVDEVHKIIRESQSLPLCKEASQERYERVMDAALGREQIFNTPVDERAQLTELDAG